MVISGAHEALADEMVDKKRIVGQVTLEQPPWLHGEAVCPLETESLEDGWRLFDLTGMECESRADAEVDAGGELIFVGGNPMFLFRAPEPNPNQIGARLTDFCCHALEFVIRPTAKWWRIGTGNDCAWKSFAK